MYQHLRTSVQGMAKSFTKGRKKRAKSAQAQMRRQFLSLESLETRAMMAVTLTGLDDKNQAIVDGGTIKVEAGAPLWIPLDGEDTAGGKLTYEVTSSNTSVVTTQLASANDKWARISVRGFGDMVFHLFNSRVPRAADRFVEMAQLGAYNTTDSANSTIHRVSKDFVIQGGKTTNSSGNQQRFDDQFDLDLQHNRTGILSFAKSTDDTNTTEWFITDGAPRFLDFNHSVFGILVEGESVREAIQNTPARPDDGSATGGQPLTPVIIDKIEIFDDIEDNVVMLKAPSGVTSGTSQITVNVRDAQNNIVATKVFNVQVEDDKANGAPFLADIPVQNAAAGATAKYQLQVLDAEGQTAPSVLNYTANVVGNVAGATAKVDPATGMLTVTPAAGFVGTLQVDVGVGQKTATDTNDKTDTQRITFNFAAAAPTVTLDSSTDTGVSNSDNITNASTLKFVVSGVTANAQVRLYANGQEIAQATSSGTSVNVNVNASALPLGPSVITARQIIGNTEGPLSAALGITYDPLILDFTSPTTATGEGNLPFTYNAENPEEGQPGFKYAFVGTPPTGMQINAQTGEVTWTPTAIGTFKFTVRAEDAAGNQKEQEVTVSVSSIRLAQFSVSFTDLNGNPITTIQKGQEFYVVARVRDLRSDATGLESAFFDVVFDSAAATVTGTIEHGDVFTQETSGTVGSGLLDEVGGKTASTALAGQTVQLFRVKMKATKVGDLAFSGDVAESKTSTARTAPSSQDTTTLDASNIQFQGATLKVVPNFALGEEEFNTDEDSAARLFDVLLHATKPDGTTLTLVSVGEGSHGGEIKVQDGKVLYKPKANFFGEETFTYTVKNQDGDTLSATAKVTVTGENDPPTAKDDTFTATEDGETQTLDVLKNDTSDPDGPENLKIKSVSSGSAGGSITIDPTNNVIRYKPKKDFVGTETFTYTIEDPGGLTSTATVTVTVSDANDPPTLGDDVIKVGQNKTDVELDVLKNDSSAPDTGETLAITGKTDPKNGTLKLVDGKLLYTPKPGFRGSDTFTYTVTDSRGGTATATVTLRVADSNAPPTAVNDQATTHRGGAIDIEVLKNDTTLPDQNEGILLTGVTQPTNGKVTIVGDKIHYEPKAGFIGKDTFTYTIMDPLGETATATVEVTVNPIAGSDIAGFVFMDFNNNGVRDVNEPGLAGVAITLTGKNQDGVAVSQTATTGMDGSYLFKDLDPGTYDVTEAQPAFVLDGRAAPGSSLGSVKSSNTMTVTITQEDTHATNFNFGEAGRKPQFIKLYELFGSTKRNSLMVATQAGQANAAWSQVDGSQWEGYQKVNVTLSSDKANVVINATDANGQKVRTTVPANDTRLVRFLGTEGNLNLLRLFGSPADFNLQPVTNVAPKFKAGADQTVLEDAAKQTVNWATEISPGAADETDQTVSFDVSVDKPELFDEVPTISADGKLSYKVKVNANGVAEVTVKAKDNGGTTNGGKDTSDPVKFKITITAVNDAPSFTAGANQTVADDAGKQTVANWAKNMSPGGGSDESSQTLTFEVKPENENFFDEQPQISADGTLTYKIRPNTTGTVKVSVTLKDNGGTANGGKESVTKDFTITATGSNGPPVAGTDAPTTEEGKEVQINVLGNDSDPDSDPLTVTILTQPGHGTAVLNADKTITYTPSGDFAGIDTFTYQIADGKGGIDTGTVNVTVTNTNDNPVAGNDTGSGDEDTPITIDLKANDTDPDSGDTLSYAVGTQPQHGTVTINATTGVATYTPTTNFSGSDTFTYTVNDGHGGTATGTVSVTVNSVNDAPTVDAPEADVTEVDTPVIFSEESGNGITIADVDVGTSDLQVKLSLGSNQGTINLGSTDGVEITSGADGSGEIVFKGTLTEIAAALDNLLYTPASGFTGAASLTIEVDDLGSTGSGGAKTVTASIHIDVADASESSFVNAVDSFMAAN
jgi:cyclophilin family peptidyl-prolyl cis-trans isomerase